MPALATPSPPPAIGLPALSTRFGFEGVDMGASPAELIRRLPKAVCAPPKAGGVSDCTAPDLDLGGGFYARDLNFRFVAGQLAQIRFHSSIDGFAYVVARLKKDFGGPKAIVRDNVRLDAHILPHVAFTWSNGRSTIDLSDPATPGQLTVRITLDSLKPNLPA